MTKQSNYQVNEISKQQLEKFISEKETVAIGFNTGNHKIFSTADLWNIQRQKKTRSQKRILTNTGL